MPESIFLTKEELEQLERLLLTKVANHREFEEMERIVDKNLHEDAIAFEGGIGLDEALTLLTMWFLEQ